MVDFVTPAAAATAETSMTRTAAARTSYQHSQKSMPQFYAQYTYTYDSAVHSTRMPY